MAKHTHIIAHTSVSTHSRTRTRTDYQAHTHTGRVQSAGPEGQGTPSGTGSPPPGRRSSPTTTPPPPYAPSGSYLRVFIYFLVIPAGHAMPRYRVYTHIYIYIYSVPSFGHTRIDVCNCVCICTHIHIDVCNCVCVFAHTVEHSGNPCVAVSADWIRVYWIYSIVSSRRYLVHTFYNHACPRKCVTYYSVYMWM